MTAEFRRAQERAAAEQVRASLAEQQRRRDAERQLVIERQERAVRDYEALVADAVHESRARKEFLAKHEPLLKAQREREAAAREAAIDNSRTRLIDGGGPGPAPIGGQGGGGDDIASAIRAFQSRLPT